MQAYEPAEKAPDQDVNHGDWLNLAETIVSYAPELLGKVVEQIRALEAADLPLPKVKQNNILIARVVAKAYYAQGQLQQAIEKAFDGRFSTKIDRDDSWTSLLMDWYGFVPNIYKNKHSKREPQFSLDFYLKK